MAPYYATDKEKQELTAGIKEFNFEDIDKFPDNLFTLISGKQGTGKTHLACTMSEIMPVYLLGTELREKLVLNKFQDSKFPIRYKPVLSYKEMVVAMKAITTKFKKERGVIVIDSGSDFQQFAEAQYKEWAKTEKVWPQYLWSRIWEMCDSVIYDIRKSGFMLVMTSRMKDEYVAEKPTGQQTPRIYNRVPYNADITLELDPLNKERPIQVTKPLEYFTGGTIAPLTKDMSLPTILRNIRI